MVMTVGAQSYRVGSILLVLGMVLAACGSPTASPTADPADPPDSNGSPGASGLATWEFEDAIRPTGEELYGGVITKWLRGDPASLDPTADTQGDVRQIVDVAYNSLLTHNPLAPEGEIIGDLARDYTVSPDGLTLTFELHEGVTWHDGEPFSSDDVAFTLNRLVDPPEGVRSPHQAELAVIEAVEAVKTPDADTVVITLSRPSNVIISVLALSTMSIVPKHLFEAEGDDALVDTILGTGPFMLEEMTRGSEFVFVRNPNYFKTGLPYLDGIRGLVIDDRATAIQALIAGQIQLSQNGLGGAEVEQLQAAAPHYETALVNTYTYWTSGIFDTESELFDDPNVRLAVSLAIDRQALIDLAGNGLGQIGGPIPPWDPNSLNADELAEFPEYDPDLTMDERRDMARQLLAEAGYPDGFDLTWIHRDDGVHIRLAQVVRDNLEQIGIRAVNQPTERTSAFEAFYAGEGNFYTWGNTFRIQDPTNQIGSCCIPGGDWNIFNYDNPELIDIWEAQDRATDPAERAELVKEMQRIVLEDRPRLWGNWAEEVMAWAPEVQNFVPHGGTLTGTARHEVLWLDE